MASTSSPYGAQIVSDMTGTPRTERIPSGIANQLASNIFKFQPVKMVPASGTITPITATTDKIWGFFAGVEYTPLGGRPVVSTFWPSGTNVDPTYDFLVYVWPAWLPGLRIRVQADGSVAQALLGSGFSFTNIANGSTSTGLSACTVGAAGIASGTQAQLFLQEFDTGVGDAIGDAYTDLICGVANPQVGFGPQTSIG
jgi:hypothetical protein